MVLSLFSSKETSVPELIAKKKYAQAVTVLRDQLKSRPDDTGLLIQLADVLALDDKAKQAVQILEKAADQLTAEGFTTKAIAALKRIERLDPGSSLRVKAKLDSLVRTDEPKPAPRPAPPPAQEISIDIGLDDSEPMALDIGIAPAPTPEPAVAPKPKAAPKPAPAPPKPPQPAPEPEPQFVPEPEPEVPDFLSGAEPPAPDFLSEPAAESDFLSPSTGDVPFVSFGEDEPEETTAPEPEPEIVVPEPEPAEPEVEFFVPEPEPEPELEVAAVEVEEVVIEPEPEPEPEFFVPEPEPEPEIIVPEPEPEPEPEFVVPEPELEPEPIIDVAAAAPEEESGGLDLDALLDAAVDSVEADAEEEGAEPEEEEESAFASLSEDETAAVIQGLDLQTFEPGDIIVSEGEPGDSMFVIASGSVKIFVKTAAGGNMPVRELYEGNFFGEIALLSGKPRSATITASSRCELLELDRETLEDISSRHPRVKERVLEIYNKRANSAAEAMLQGIDEDEGPATAAPVGGKSAAPAEAPPKDSYAGVELKDTALAMMRAGQWTDASALWELYLSVSPGDTSARASLGLCMAKVGDWQSAVSAFEAVTAENPGDASSFFSLAVAYSKLGKKAESKAALQKTLEADPSHAKAKSQLAKM